MFCPAAGSNIYREKEVLKGKLEEKFDNFASNETSAQMPGRDCTQKRGEKMKAGMVKMMTAALTAACLMGMLTGCTTTKSETTTTTTTDANGNTTTTTTSKTTENGKTTESTTTTTTSETAEEENTAEDSAASYVATLSISNETGADIYALYFSSNQSDEWGDSIIDEGDPLEDGYTITYHDAFTYDSDYLIWDLQAEDADGNAITFEGLDMSYAEDPENITISLCVEDDGYTAYVE